MAEWPEWLLEVIISNYEMGSVKDLNGVSIEEIEDLVHNFLIIMLEHSMRQKDGWKDVEATIHCAEWLSMIGGSSTGDQRIRREEALPIFKRRLLGGLLDFAARELQVQTEIMAAAAAGVAAEGLSPEDAKEEADNAVQLSVALAENAIVVLMLVEDHLRLQAQLTHSSKSANGIGSPANANSTNITRSNSLSRTGSGSFDSFGSKRSSTDTGGLSLDILASMADANGQVSASVMEKLTAAAAAEPYESVRCAFISYGSCVIDLAEDWKYRSKLWYGVGPNTNATCGGGGSGWEHWNSMLERDSNENWIELPLVKKSVAMLQALLLDECAIGGGSGAGFGSGSSTCGIKALYQFLDSDQPFLCMLRMVLTSMREEDNGEDEILMRNISIKDGISEGLSYHSGKLMTSDSSNRMLFRKPRSALLWSVLGPILNMPIAESKRQRVLVACCILYSEVWHAVGKDGKPLRKQYIENILPQFVAILRRWRPLLASIHELTSADYENPLTIDDPALAAESLPIEAALSMITPGWAAAFASPPAAMALAMIAAGTSGGETVSTPRSIPLRRDTSLLERRSTRLHTFSSFQKPLETPSKTPSVPKDKAAAKAAALAAARDLERRAKIGTGRGLSAVAMATSAQRRSVTDSDRAKRWNTFEAMASAWTECLQSFDSKTVPGRDLSKLSYNYVAVLVTSFALARNMQRMEMDRSTQVELLSNYSISSGSRAWRKLLCCLIEMSGLFGPLGDSLCNPKIVFWKLDSTISSMRMRRYMKRDYKVSQHFIEENTNASINRSETQFDTSLLAEAISAKDNHDDTDNENMAENNTEHDNVCNQNLVYSTLEVAPIFVPSETDERILLELPASLVWPHITLQGNFQMTTKRVNFIVDEKNNNRSVTFPQRIEPVKNRSWLISSIYQVYNRRYLLRMSALELFMSDRSSYLFDFGSIEGRKIAYRAIVNARPPHLNTCYMETQRPDQLLKKTQLMERWARWEISNFEYLMELNVLAGRSYNDVTQYPVFPWILVDYFSNNLNLDDSSTYRDLSKPIGAQKSDRLMKFQERYSSSKDPVTLKFHYNTHYSSAETVLYYLARLEPFATLSIQLHGGKSNLSNHMLSDIGSTWKSVLSDMRDVKELVPELFYMPEILMKGDSFDCVTLPPWAENPVDFIHKHRMALESVHVSTHLHEWIDLIFGCKQRGEEAVSANNVFHYSTYEGRIDIDKVADPVRQRAIQDQISYFGQTPFQLLTVPHLKKTPLGDALHLKTIFRNPSNIKPFGVPNPEHCNVPAAAISATYDTVVVVGSNAPAANVAVHKWSPNTPDEQGIPFQFHHGESSAGTTSGAFLRMLTGHGESTSEEWQFPHALAYPASGIQNSAVVAITCDNEVITGGHADNSVKLISADKAKTIETASGHCAPVTCLALSPDSSYLVTGSRDTTVILWRMHRPNPHSRTTPDSTSGLPSTPTSPLIDSDRANNLDRSRKRRIEGPMHVLRGHLEEVVCCCVSSDLGLIASCSNGSGILLHTIKKGRLIRKLDAVNVHSIRLSSQGVILVWNEVEDKLSTFSVNGIPIATKVLSPFAGIISCIETSADGKYALLGTCSLADDADCMELSSVATDSSVSAEGKEKKRGVPVPSVLFLDLHTLEVFHSLPLGDGQNVTAIALDKDNTNLLVSTADKQLIVFTDPSVAK